MAVAVETEEGAMTVDATIEGTTIVEEVVGVTDRCRVLPLTVCHAEAATMVTTIAGVDAVVVDAGTGMRAMIEGGTIAVDVVEAVVEEEVSTAIACQDNGDQETSSKTNPTLFQRRAVAAEAVGIVEGDAGEEMDSSARATTKTMITEDTMMVTEVATVTVVVTTTATTTMAITHTRHAVEVAVGGVVVEVAEEEGVVGEVEEAMERKATPKVERVKVGRAHV